jgi:hypothetical protein
VNQTASAAAQTAAMEAFFDDLADRGERLVYIDSTDAADAAREAIARASATSPAWQLESAARSRAGEALAA